jgi:hypothetical protein
MCDSSDRLPTCPPRRKKPDKNVMLLGACTVMPVSADVGLSWTIKVKGLIFVTEV